MTTFSIAMSKNTAPKTVAQELAYLPEALDSVTPSSNGQSIILARVVGGISCESWEEVCKNYPLGEWSALPVPTPADATEDVETLQTCDGRQLPISPFREVRGGLTKSMFIRLLKRELLRLSRNNGSLSLVAAALADRREVLAALGQASVERLDALLGATLLDHLEGCDALGVTRKGVFICSLPGLGQLAARHFAENTQKAFREAARQFFPAGGLGAGSGGSCAMGIVNIMHGEACAVNDLLRRAATALEAALLKSGGYIHQEAPLAPFEGTTLVHSSEKRFLFFGGDPA